jgi:hypothetical protein
MLFVEKGIINFLMLRQKRLAPSKQNGNIILCQKKKARFKTASPKCKDQSRSQ